MSIACDFRKKLADRHEETVCVAAPGGLAHICEEYRQQRLILDRFGEALR